MDILDLIPLMTLFLFFVFVMPSAKKQGKNYLMRDRLKEAIRSREEVMETAYEVLTGAYSLSIRREAASVWCAVLAGKGDPACMWYSNLLSPDEAQKIRAELAVKMGDWDWAIEVCRKKIAEGNPGDGWYLIMAEAFAERGDTEQAYESCRRGLDVLRGKKAEALARNAFRFARMRFDLPRAEEALSFARGQASEELAMERDELATAIGRLKERGTDAAEYLRQLSLALAPLRRTGAAIRFVPFFGLKNNYIGGQCEFDAPWLKREKASFFAQICLFDLPDPVLKKKDVCLRFWVIRPEALKEGVYPVGFINRKTVGFVGAARESEETPPAAVVLGNPCPRTLSSDEMNVREPDYFLDPEVVSFEAESVWPDECSAAVEEACRKRRIPLPAQALGEYSPLLRREPFMAACYPDGKWLPELQGRDFCLFRAVSDDRAYAFCMSREAYLNDRFDDVVLAVYALPSYARG